MFVLMLNAFTGNPIRNKQKRYSFPCRVKEGSPTNMSIMDNAERYGQEPDDVDSDSLIEQSQPKQQEAEASSLIKLDNGDVLYMREVNR